MPIKLEDLKKELETNAEIKEFIDGIVEESVTGLKTKNSDLIQKNKKLKEEKDTLQTQIDEADEASLNDDKDKLKDKKIDVDSIVKKETAKLQNQIKTLQDEKTGVESKYNNLVVDTALSDAIMKSNIAKQHIPAVKALIKSTAKIEISSDDDKPSALVGDKALDVYVKEFAQGDTGKHYVAAAANNGGGASGSDKSSSGGADVSKMSPQEKMNFARAQQS